MHVPHNSQYIQVFNGMAQFYNCFIKNFPMIMVLITKFTRKTESFTWTKEYQKAWKRINQKYIEATILIPPKWDVEFHVHIVTTLTLGL